MLTVGMLSFFNCFKWEDSVTPMINPSMGQLFILLHFSGQSLELSGSAGQWVSNQSRARA